VTTATASTRAYQEQAVLTAPPARLVVMLYDGATRFLAQGAAAMRAGDVERSNERLQRAEAILDELMATLDPDAGEIAASLRDLYLFCRRQLSEVRISRDADAVDAVRSLLVDLRGSWNEIAATA
jgi:flagellar protein FliS